MVAGPPGEVAPGPDPPRRPDDPWYGGLKDSLSRCRTGEMHIAATHVAASASQVTDHPGLGLPSQVQEERRALMEWVSLFLAFCLIIWAMGKTKN